jgi:hypothetical protein
MYDVGFDIQMKRIVAAFLPVILLCGCGESAKDAASDRIEKARAALADSPLHEYRPDRVRALSLHLSDAQKALDDQDYAAARDEAEKVKREVDEFARDLKDEKRRLDEEWGRLAVKPFASEDLRIWINNNSANLKQAALDRVKHAETLWSEAQEAQKQGLPRTALDKANEAREEIRQLNLALGTGK